MELSDLIKSDSDRLFMLDHECFVIFTGDTFEDEKPFIRIGNWMHLPVEIIPLIENIIITDRMAGNPSLEQFNIDIMHLATNRYIGSRASVKKFLDFQGLFGLDLTNAHIVEVEKDIPEVSHEKIISNRDSFIGIFYTNGNFRITHRKNRIFDLMELERICPGDYGIHEELTRKNREIRRYGGSGMVLIENNPLFYKNGFLTAYHFPRAYYEEFERLQIDPAGIRDVLLPSSNPLHLTRLVKWKHLNKGRLRILCDSRENHDILQRLYSGATLVRQNFKGLSFESGEGLSISNYPGTYNLKLRYSRVSPSSRDLNLAYIKGTAGIGDIIKERLDGIIVGYSIFEEANLLLRNSGVPVAVIAEKGTAPSRLRAGGFTVLQPGTHYEFTGHEDFDGLARAIAGTLSSPELSGIPDRPDEESIRGAVAKLGNSSDEGSPRLSADRYNFRAWLTALLHSTEDRRLASRLRKLIQETAGFRDALDTPGITTRFRINLAFCRGTIIDYLEETGATPPSRVLRDEIPGGETGWTSTLNDDYFRGYYDRIISDRERLLKLLSLYSRQYGQYAAMPALKKAIERKKEEFLRNDPLPVGETGEETPGFSAKTLVKPAIILLLLIALGTGAYMGVRSWNNHRVERQRAAEKKARDELIKKYNIRVREVDIFHYVNRVAVLNGFSPIAFRDLRKKNPHWIYPGNVFTMPDGEKITVVEGDTLWDISHHKLMGIHLDFYKTLDDVKKELAGGGKPAEGMIRLEKLAFTDEHRAALEDVRRKAGR